MHVLLMAFPLTNEDDFEQVHWTLMISSFSFLKHDRMNVNGC